MAQTVDPRMREPLDGGIVELRASPTVVTETTVVTEETVVRFGENGEEEPAAESRAFVESVYESHARAWRRADPVASGRRRAVSG